MNPHKLLPRRRFLAGAAALACAGCAPAAPVPRQSGALRVIGEAIVPFRARFRETTIGGLSALDYDSSRDCWYALSDDRSNLQPARFYTLKLPLSRDKFGPPLFTAVTTLRQADGRPYPSARDGGDVPDPEGLRWNAASGTLLWTSEGDARLRLAPFLRETKLDGSHVRELELPRTLRAGDGTGPRDNLGFEGLALTPDGLGAWTAMEGPLHQDGEPPAVGRPGGPCRITLWDVPSGQPVRQFAYLPDAIPRAPLLPGTFADNGISEILMADAHRMLVLERSYSAGVGNSLRLYVIDTREGSDTLDSPVLRPGGYTPCRKQRIADFAQLGLARLDNTEGMAWGPSLPGGGRTLVVVSDDNFNPAQVTQFVAFEARL
ncbi:MAG: esterase-like activity of phytase family protein [Burkholderiaceae bacterium]